MDYQFEDLIYIAGEIVIGADCDEFEAGFQIYFYFHLWFTESIKFETLYSTFWIVLELKYCQLMVKKQHKLFQHFWMCRARD